MGGWISRFSSTFSNLVLTRKAQESIVISGPDGKFIGSFKIADIHRGRIRIELKFPNEYRIEREELFDARMEEKEKLLVH